MVEEVSVVRASAAIGARAAPKRTVSSVARCCASAALPPLPKSRILPPPATASAAHSTKWTKAPPSAPRLAAATAKCSSKPAPK
jgi:hypothetical protein